ncbi:tail fiber assembly protein [Pseudomonas putida]|uniref:tail fiber assembly protein n=1 Tax=Pseudomonas putida TaxID=303 RepID=UPI001D0FBC8D|nr:tail fiber assembly protein [Pseudomonas putida]MDD2019049.1 tail fiber assembly protein [Pseudomonas putida]
MLIKLSPVRADVELTVFKQGDSLTLNGLTLDFSPLPEGASLPATATGCEWVVGDVVRINGQLIITLSLPHGPDASEAARFPADIVEPANGRVALPIPGALQPSLSQGYAAIDWGQIVTAEDQALAAIQHEHEIAIAELARRRLVADAAIAPLQDAVDLEDATTEEAEALKAWKRYRIVLSRLPEQAGYPHEIDWPEVPA